MWAMEGSEGLRWSEGERSPCCCCWPASSCLGASGLALELLSSDERLDMLAEEEGGQHR